MIKEMNTQLSLFDEQFDYMGIPIHLPGISFKKTKQCYEWETTVHHKNKPLFRLCIQKVDDCKFGNINYETRALDNNSGKGFIDYKNYVEEILNEDIRAAIIKEETKND